MNYTLEYCRQLLLEILITGKLPWNDTGFYRTQPSIGMALLLIDSHDKHQLLLAERCQ